jgi:hypothetical protein
MSKEMAGSDNQDFETYSLTPLRVAEVDSFFSTDSREVGVDPTRLVLEISRKYCEPNEKIYKDDPRLKKDPVEAAKNINITPDHKHISDNPVAETLTLAAAKVHAAKENLKLSPKQKEHFEGVEENFIGGIPFFTGPAVEAIKAEKSRINKYINQQIGKGVRATAASILILQMATGCVKQAEGGFPTELVIPPTPIVQTIEAPTQAATIIPAGNETEVLTEAKTRLPVTAVDVKNVEPSVVVSVDQTGNLIGLPAQTTPDKIDAVKNFYDAIAEKFPGSTVYYDEDTGETGQWILYAISPDGKLYNSQVSYAGGPAQFADYPIPMTDWVVHGK